MKKTLSTTDLNIDDGLYAALGAAVIFMVYLAVMIYFVY